MAQPTMLVTVIYTSGDEETLTMDSAEACELRADFIAGRAVGEYGVYGVIGSTVLLRLTEITILVIVLHEQDTTAPVRSDRFGMDNYLVF